MSFLPLAEDFRDPRSVLDADELVMKLTHAEPYREVTPFDKDMTDNYKESAYESHNTLVEMGGRPTRAVLEKPAGKAVYKKKEGRIDIIDEHGKLTTTLEYDMDPMNHHWSTECYRFEQELDRWKEFMDYQRRNPQLSPLKTAFDLGDADQSLKLILIRLNEWREFEVYHQCKVDTALMSTWRTRQALEKLFSKESTFDQAAPDSENQSLLGTWFGRLFPTQMKLDACQTQLTCIENQGVEMLAEASASLEGAPLLSQQLEKKMEEQTNAVYRDLELQGARPSHAAQACSPTAPYVQRILYWKAETSRLLRERREWKMFLKWRRNQPNARTPVSMEVQESNNGHVDPALWIDYVTYRQSLLDKAINWVDCWRRFKRSTEIDEEESEKAGMSIFKGSIESIQKEVERFQQDVHTARVHLISAQQQLAELFPQQSTSPARRVSEQTSKCPQLPPSPPDSDASGRQSTNGKHSDLRTSPTKANRPAPTHESSELLHPLSTLSQVRKKRAKNDDTDGGQLIAVPVAIGSGQVILDDDDVEMTDAPGLSHPHPAIGNFGRAEPRDTLVDGVEDIRMIDARDPVNITSPPASEVDVKVRGTRNAKKSPLSNYQMQTSRKTRSATKLDQAVSSRILKIQGKNPVKKAKVYTEQQTMVLLNAASIGDSPTDPPLLRRSERLKQKAAASVFMSPPQLNATQTPQSSMQKKPKTEPNSIGPCRSSTRKKLKRQPDILESLKSLRQKKPRERIDAVESSRSSRQKKARTQHTS